jgi:transaldolase
MRTYNASRELLASPRWQKLAARGALPQRLLWGSTETKDPTAPDGLYVEALAAPDTVNTMPEKTLLAFADCWDVKGAKPIDGGNAGTLAADLQREGTAAFARSWNELMSRIASKRGLP